MSDFIEEINPDAPANPGADVEMREGAEDTTATANPNVNASELPFAQEDPEEDSAPAPRVTFAQYLTSPVVTLLVGSGEAETILTAHQSLLVQSPFFAEACAQFADDGSVSLTAWSSTPYYQLSHSSSASDSHELKLTLPSPV